MCIRDRNTDALILPKDIPEWLHTIQKPVMELISKLSVSQEPYSEFLETWKVAVGTDKISLMLYQTEPLSTQLLKKVIPWLVIKNQNEKTLNFLKKLNVIDTPEYKEALTNLIDTIILNGSKEEQKNLTDLHHNRHLVGSLSVNRDTSYKQIMSYLPHLTAYNARLIILMIHFLSVTSDPQLIEDIVNYLIPILQDKNSAKFRAAKYFLRLISKEYTLISLPNDRLIPIFSELAKNLFSTGSIEEIRSCLLYTSRCV